MEDMGEKKVEYQELSSECGQPSVPGQADGLKIASQNDGQGEDVVEETGERGPTGEVNKEAVVSEQADVEVLQQQLAEQTVRADEYFNRLVRLQADFENYRRRVAREKEELLQFANEQLITDLLPVLDNFERALASDRKNTAQIVEGVQMIYSQLQGVLTARGLTPIVAVGEKFDPARHEAVLVEETSDHQDNIVLEELRKGYYFKDKVIRPSMVKVARPVKEVPVVEEPEVSREGDK